VPETYSPTPFGQILKLWMTKTGLTQRQLADAVGVTPTMVYMVLSGRRRMLSEPYWPALSKAMDLPIDKIKRAARLTRSKRETICTYCQGMGVTPDSQLGPK
jgi:transcriptional regulator with XRE-family HTH domain